MPRVFIIINNIIKKSYSVRAIYLVLNLACVIFLLSCFDFYREFIDIKYIQDEKLMQVAISKNGDEPSLKEAKASFSAASYFQYGDAESIVSEPIIVNEQISQAVSKDEPLIEKLNLPLDLTFVAFNNQFDEIMLVARILPDTALNQSSRDALAEMVLTSNSFINPRLSLSSANIYNNGQAIFAPLKGSPKLYPFDKYQLALHLISAAGASTSAETGAKNEASLAKKGGGAQAYGEGNSQSIKLANYSEGAQQAGVYAVDAEMQLLAERAELAKSLVFPNLRINSYKNAINSFNIEVKNYENIPNYEYLTQKTSLHFELKRHWMSIFLIVSVFLASILLSFQHFSLAFVHNFVIKYPEIQYALFTALIIGLGYFTRTFLLTSEQNFTYFYDLLYLFTLFLPLLGLILRIARFFLLMPSKNGQ